MDKLEKREKKLRWHLFKQDVAEFLSGKKRANTHKIMNSQALVDEMTRPYQPHAHLLSQTELGMYEALNREGYGVPFRSEDGLATLHTGTYNILLPEITSQFLDEQESLKRKNTTFLGSGTLKNSTQFAFQASALAEGSDPNRHDGLANVIQAVHGFGSMRSDADARYHIYVLPMTHMADGGGHAHCAAVVCDTKTGKPCTLLHMNSADHPMGAYSQKIEENRAKFYDNYSFSGTLPLINISMNTQQDKLLWDENCVQHSLLIATAAADMFEAMPPDVVKALDAVHAFCEVHDDRRRKTLPQDRVAALGNEIPASAYKARLPPLVCAALNIDPDSDEAVRDVMPGEHVLRPLEAKREQMAFDKAPQMQHARQVLAQALFTQLARNIGVDDLTSYELKRRKFNGAEHMGKLHEAIAEMRWNTGVDYIKKLKNEHDGWRARVKHASGASSGLPDF